MVKFGNVQATSGGSFNGSTTSAKTEGFYWMHIAANTPSYKQAFIGILGGNSTYLRIAKTHSGFAVPDTTSRSGVVNARLNNQTYFLSNYTTQSLYWSSFRLDNVFSPLVVFQVASTSVMFFDGIITYNQLFINNGSAWNATLNSFIAPFGGLYFFSLSAGMHDGVAFHLKFAINGVVVQDVSDGTALSMNPGYDLLTVSKLLQLRAGDVLTTAFSNGILYSDPSNLQISLAGFYYSPTLNSQVGHNVFIFKCTCYIAIIFQLQIGHNYAAVLFIFLINIGHTAFEFSRMKVIRTDNYF